jgi:hypothetical protein
LHRRTKTVSRKDVPIPVISTDGSLAKKRCPYVEVSEVNKGVILTFDFFAEKSCSKNIRSEDRISLNILYVEKMLVKHRQLT